MVHEKKMFNLHRCFRPSDFFQLYSYGKRYISMGPKIFEGVQVKLKVYTFLYKMRF